ncbi:hypothetical protein CVT24_012265 [Panaeolus cyanescens]|uniref:C2H2-type domain-containing protein n=1 Tax=Panaeolus cyanescens TaxID=181874 RepID=A0A409YJ65_9AGAR|nr:hypothetical protein CVT24_012265 [Panaeolus cyanescens]
MASTSQLSNQESTPFKCDSCEKGFSKQQGLSLHRQKCKAVQRTQKAIEDTSTIPQDELSRPQKRAKTSRKKGRNVAESSTYSRVHDVSNSTITGPEIMASDRANGEAIVPLPDNPHMLVDEPEPPFPPEALTQTTSNIFVPPPTRRGRERKFPKKYDDFLPCTRTRIPHLPPPPPPPPPLTQSVQEPTPLPPPPPEIGSFTTEVNEFGMYRVYPTMPSREIDENEELANVCDGPGLSQPTHPPLSRWFKSSGLTDPGAQGAGTHSKGMFAPFLNATVYKLFWWFYTGGNTKSVGEFQRLVDEVLDQPDYSPADVKGLKVSTVLSSLDSHDPTISPFALEDGWKKSSVSIPLPCKKVSHPSENHCPTLTIPDVYHRPLLDTIKSAFKDQSSLQFHYTPFKQYWKSTPTSPPERVVTELYNSDAFYEEHIKLMKRQPSADEMSQPYYETAIAAIMLWSDLTHLANFGNASLWPIDLYLGNLSKYVRANLTSCSAHHLAYIPSLPPNLQDIYMKAFNVSASKDTISHLKRELMHAVWLLILDPELMKAYEHGFVMQCSDGIWRRIFPRFFTYSADYPEKVLLATIKYLAKCPCPRCTTEKQFIPALGTHVDSQRRSHKRTDNNYRQFDIEEARKDIYKHAKGAKSAAVDSKLGGDSSIPVWNTFSVRLFKHGFNFYDMFVLDLLHEFELGVWKAVFTHLMRILYATGDNNAIQILNKSTSYC